ncbi:MAG TPA: zinc ABC transporter substrate-binding protein [Candidatus Methylacidiphilales bacterium]
MSTHLLKTFFLCLGSVFLGLAGRASDLKIVAAENFYGGVAQQIAGSGAMVKSILTNPNQDPHEFTTNAATAKAVADADVVIYSGISYDPWMDKVLAAGGKPGRVVIIVADLIGAKDGDNPHIWYEPRTMPALGAKLVEVLSKIDPAQAATYQKRLDDFNASMNGIVSTIAKIKALSGGTPVTATEPVFGYMADALGFKMLNYDFQVKIMNDAEPTADQTAAFEKSLTSKTAKILFYNSQVTDPTTDRLQKIARQAGIPIVGVTETQPLDQKSYVDWMSSELSAVESALHLALAASP